MKIIKNEKEVINGAFGKWILALFHGIEGWNPDILFDKQKEAFFCLLEKLLKEGKIRFDVPMSRYAKTKEEYWDAPAEEIINHMKKGWPKSAKEKNDSDLNDYFYDTDRCPIIYWLGKDGEWYGS